MEAMQEGEEGGKEEEEDGGHTEDKEGDKEDKVEDKEGKEGEDGEDKEGGGADFRVKVGDIVLVLFSNLNKGTKGEGRSSCADSFKGAEGSKDGELQCLNLLIIIFLLYESVLDLEQHEFFRKIRFSCPPSEIPKFHSISTILVQISMLVTKNN
jgi:hypothetical protein